MKSTRQLSKLFFCWLVLALGVALPAAPGAAQSTTPVKIMPLGDSITDSYNGRPDLFPAGRPSYRYRLWNKLTEAGFGVNFVGGQYGDDGEPVGYSFDQDHEGHSGWRADQVLPYVEGWARAVLPDVVLLHLGTNDVFQSDGDDAAGYVDTTTNAQTINELSQIIDKLRLANPKVKVLLAAIIPGYKYKLQTQDLNGRISTLAAQKNTSTSRVYLVDQWEGFDASTDTYDGVHPNGTGEYKMAERWYPTLVDALTAPSGGVLSGSASTPSSSVDLTTEGTGDWAHWGRNNTGTGGGSTTAAIVDRKASGGGKISNYSLVSGGTVVAYGGNSVVYKWTDGSPTATNSSAASGFYVAGIGNGFRITAPADTTERTLKVYVGGWKSTGRLRASLSDGSASVYTAEASNSTDVFHKAYTLRYKAGSVGRSLTVEWSQTAGTGNVTLEAATLKDGTTTAPAPTPTAGLLSGASASPSSSVNLTSDGTLDWGHWGRLKGATSGMAFNHKASGGGRISNYTLIGGVLPRDYAGNAITYSWSDGTPTTSNSTASGIYTSGAGNGFRITAPADTTERTLKVYVGGWKSTGQLRATLSDGSASAYTAQASNSTDVFHRVYTIRYRALSAGQTLTVQWTQSGTSGNVNLQGAALR